MTETTDKELYYASQEDVDIFLKSVEGLPTREGFNGNYHDKYGVEIPYGSEAHIVRHFKKAIEIVNPKRILEIGFNFGSSSAMWLNLFDGTVVSCDVSDKEETVAAAKVLKERFGTRFDFYFRGEMELSPNYFDMIFIDGSHLKNDVVIDIHLSKVLEIPYVLLDDCLPRFGEAMEAVKQFPKLKLVHDMNNIKLYQWQ